MDHGTSVKRLSGFIRNLVWQFHRTKTNAWLLHAKPIEENLTRVNPWSTYDTMPTKAKGTTIKQKCDHKLVPL